MPLNRAKPAEDFVASFPKIPDKKPAIHMYGGTILEPQFDPAKGVPSSCGFNVDLVSQLAAALSPLQPLLTILDTVAHLAQCFQLMTEVMSDPFKIPDLIACVPGLIGKINALLALVPPFPQGVVQIATFVVDVVRFTGNMIACIVDQLTSVKDMLAQIAQITEAINNCEDDAMRANLELYRDEAAKTTQESVTIGLAALGPIARVLCITRAMLAMTGDDGKKIAEKMSFPDPSNIQALDDAIDALKLTRDILLTTVEIIENIAAPFGGILPAPDIAFKCPLDVPTAPEDEVVPVPQIESVLPATAAKGDPDTPIVILGTGFSKTQSQVYWNTTKLKVDTIEAVPRTSPDEVQKFQIGATVRAQLLTNVGTFQIMVSNAPATKAKPFSGLTDPLSGFKSSASPVQNSNQVAFEVT